MRAILRELSQSDDPAKGITDALGDLSGFECFHNLVLVGTFIRPEKSKGGIIYTDQTLREDEFQGKAGLVLKMGPLAFQDDNIAKFGGVTIKPGDWVLYRPSDGMQLTLPTVSQSTSGVACRLFEDTMIKGRIAHPAMIF